ncbi:MAG: alanine racemase [Patescibacteria group bacterium]|nr:alanine racemase [Patescibacteria group bacterium]
MDNKLLSWIEIDKSALLNNLTAFKKLVGSKVEVMPIIKSNAYGHGLIEVAKIFAPKSNWLGVVNLDEALLLRKNRINNKIFVLSYFDEKKLSLAAGKNIVFPVYTVEMAKMISLAGLKARKRIPVHIKIDVGTSRIGILPNEAINFAKKIKKLAGLEIQGAFSHLADSENFDQSYTNSQIKVFQEAIHTLEENGFNLRYKHLACSASTIINPRSRFDLVRVGIGLYGLWPSKGAKDLFKRHLNGFKLIPALSWHTKVIQIKSIPERTNIGYGCTYKTKRLTKLAILPIGYWDGYDRKLSSKGEVLISGKRAKILGRVCMNMMMIDTTDISNVRAGDRATLIGRQGREYIGAEELAEKAGTINYEMVARINPLIPRIVV